MKSKKSDQEIWARELEFAQRQQFWGSFALETRCCAEFLLTRFEDALHQNDNLKSFFAYKYVRMLFGYSIENLVKGLLLSGDRSNMYIKEDRISFGNSKGHNLKWLLAEIDYPVDEEDALYLYAWSVSTMWFGKYPFPLGVSGVLDEYQSMQSRESLLRRSIEGKREFLLSDLLHQDIGAKERRFFESLFDSLAALYEV